MRSITKKDLKVPEKPKLKCLRFTYNEAKLFNMMPIQMKKTENPNTFKTMTKDWIQLISYIFSWYCCPLISLQNVLWIMEGDKKVFKKL